MATQDTELDIETDVDIEDELSSVEVTPEVEESKKQKRLRWTDYEEATLVKLAGKLSAEQIASIMGRSVQSVKMRANALKLSLKSKKAVWTQEKLDELYKMKSKGMGWKEIAKAMKCTEMACMKVFQRSFGTRETLLKNRAINVLDKVLETIRISDELKSKIRTGVENGF